MNPLPFIAAAYGMVMGGAAVYAAWLWRRLAKARRELEGAAPAPDPPRNDG